MALFRARPLAAGCLIFILCVPAAFSLSGLALFLLPAVALVFPAAALFLRRRAPYASFCLVLFFLCAALGMGSVLIDSAIHRETDSAVGTEKQLTLRVEEVTYESTYRSEYTVKLVGTRGRAVLRADGELQPTPGTVIRGRFSVKALSFESYYDGQANAYFAEGLRVILIPEEVESVTPGAPSFLARLGGIGTRAAARLRAVSGERAGGLAAAMLLGDRSGLDDATVRDFRRTGVSHLLAISGLHLSILAWFLDRLLFRLHFGKKARSCLTMLFCIGYCLLTGASYSTIRAALMFCVFCLAFLLRSDADPITSLLFAGACIAAVSPCAVYSVSYQMTMLATFGILAYSRLRKRLCAYIPARGGVPGLALRLVRVLITSLCVTFCATLAILPVQWVAFGEVAPVSFAANLLLLPLTPALLVFSLLALTFSGIPGAFRPFSFTVSLIADILRGVTSRLSAAATPVSLRYSFVPFILVPMFLLLALLLIIDLKKLAPLALSPVPVALAAFLICFAVSGNLSRGRADTVYYQKGNSEGLLLFGKGSGLICELSGGSESALTEEYRALRELGATEVRVLVFARYEDAQPYTLSAFSGRVLVRELWVSEPKNDEERQILFSICEVAEREHIALTVFERNRPLTVFGSGKMTFGTPFYETRSVKPAFWVRLDFPQTSLLYACAAYPEYAAHRGKVLPGADILLLGNAGPSMKETVGVPAGFPLVVLTGSAQLEHLTISDGCRYLYLPEKFRILLK